MSGLLKILAAIKITVALPMLLQMVLLMTQGIYASENTNSEPALLSTRQETLIKTNDLKIKKFKEIFASLDNAVANRLANGVDPKDVTQNNGRNFRHRSGNGFKQAMILAGLRTQGPRLPNHTLDIILDYLLLESWSSDFEDLYNPKRIPKRPMVIRDLPSLRYGVPLREFFVTDLKHAATVLGGLGLARAQPLDKLVLSGLNFTDSTTDALAILAKSFAAKEVVVLECTLANSAGVRALGGLIQGRTKSLTVRLCQVGDPGMAALKQCLQNSKTDFTFGDCGDITEEWSAVFSKMFPKTTTLWSGMTCFSK